jgi:AmmeMemoRadiSam system protein B
MARPDPARARPAAVAGRFYPDDADALEAAVRAALAQRPPDPADPPKALIAPHAGYVYSGPVAASAYARVAACRGRVARVVLLGPAHRVPVRGLAVPSAAAFATPLGEVPLDRDALGRALALPQVEILDVAHAHEHSLEVQLPFLQVVLGSFALAPFLVGDARPAEVAELLELLWGGPETLIVVSSDLSHYHDAATARRMDAHTTRAIEDLRPEAIGWDDACGRVPIQGLLLAARRHGLRARALDVRNSGDTAGPSDSVVGYGAYELA